MIFLHHKNKEMMTEKKKQVNEVSLFDNMDSEQDTAQVSDNVDVKYQLFEEE